MFEINVLMIGARGVGKTSTLTSMYNEFNTKMGNDSLDIQLMASDETSTKLNKKLAELKKSVGETRISKPAIAGSTAAEEFMFFLGEDESTKSIELKFRDFPGSYIEEKQSKVKAWIKESQVIIIPIDTPALLEEAGKYNEEYNKPSQIADIFKNVKTSFSSRKHLILFVPLKSEKYLDENSYGTNKIVEKVEQHYAQLLNIFRSGGLNNNTAIAITPIQTVGGIKFSRIDNKNGNPEFIYIKKGAKSKYEPKDTDQPLRYILSFAIKEKLDNLSLFESLKSMFGLFGGNEAFKKAVENFSRNIKQDNNFKILQNDSFFKS